MKYEYFISFSTNMEGKILKVKCQFHNCVQHSSQPLGQSFYSIHIKHFLEMSANSLSSSLSNAENEDLASLHYSNGRSPTWSLWQIVPLGTHTLAFKLGTGAHFRRSSPHLSSSLCSPALSSKHLPARSYLSLEWNQWKQTRIWKYYRTTPIASSRSQTLSP